MKTKAFYCIALLLILFACNKPKEPKNGDNEEFCSFLNVENMDKTIPIINEWLTGQPNNLTDVQKLNALAAWLKAQPCIKDATVCAETNPPKNEILISFDENGITKSFVLEFSTTPPLKATGFREVDPKVVFCLYLNTENFGKTIPFINEWLSALPDAVDLEELASWLKSSFTCVDDARITNGEYGESGMSELVITFKEEGMTKTFILDISVKDAKVEGYYEYIECDLCPDIDLENLDKLIPAMNKFLSGLRDGLTGYQKLRVFANWLKRQSCVDVAFIDHYSGIKTNPMIGEIVIRFSGASGNDWYDRNNYIGVLWTNPMTVIGVHSTRYRRPYQDGDTEEPIVVEPFTRNPLGGTYCQLYPGGRCEWLHFEAQFFARMEVINSVEELKNYIECGKYNLCSYPIDFTKYTLLLAQSQLPGFSPDLPYLYRYSTGYVLCIDFFISQHNGASGTPYALLVDKLPEGSHIDLFLNNERRK